MTDMVETTTATPIKKSSPKRKKVIHPGRPPKIEELVDSLNCRWNGCNLSFPTAEAARLHETQHGFPGPFDLKDDEEICCRMKGCMKVFPDIRQLRKHLHLHRPRQYTCKECGKKFHEATKLKRHEQVHTGQKPFSCDKCGKEFGFKANLKTHMRTHTGERPFACTFEGCNRRFAQASNRNAHVQVHYRSMEKETIVVSNGNQAPSSSSSAASVNPPNNKTSNVSDTRSPTPVLTTFSTNTMDINQTPKVVYPILSTNGTTTLPIVFPPFPTETPKQHTSRFVEVKPSAGGDVD